MKFNDYIGFNMGGFLGLGITYYWGTRYAGNRRGVHKIYIHLLIFRIVVTWGGKRKAYLGVEEGK